MDERAGVEEARRLGLTAVGTLGVLALASQRKLIELPAAIERLRKTNFRVDPRVIEGFLAAEVLKKL